MSDLHVPAEGLSAREAYRLMTGIITPRPIAWVSTTSARGQGNLAPYSYFQGVSSSPPTVVLGMGSRPDGRPKDSLRNILDTREFTVCHVGERDAESMNESSAGFEPGVDEAQRLGLEMLPGEAVSCPRVASARAALECVLTHAIPIGLRPDGSPSSTLVVGRVVGFWLAQDLVQRDAQGRLAGVDAQGLASVGRLGGLSYTRTSSNFDLPRPVAPPKPET